MLVALRLLFACLMAMMATLAVAASPTAERRVALVIGNSDYKNFPSLPNPRNDAADLSAALRNLGFEVIDGPDVTKSDMEAKLQRFARLASESDAALVFYAGHGLQYQGQNYLVPTDAKLQDEIDLDYETIRVEEILRALDRARNVRILILDACRNLPLPDRGNRRDIFHEQGLAKIGRKGMVVAYATQANEVAYDGTGRNSFFTGALLKELAEPGLEIGQLFRRVQADVNQKTQGRQMPELSVSLPGDFYMNRGETDTQAWARVRNSSDVSALQAFVTRFPNSFYVEDAKSRVSLIQQLAAAQENARRRVEEEAARQKAEQERLAQLKREEEARQKAEQDRLARAKREQEEAARQKAEQERLAWARLEEEQKRRAQEQAARDQAAKEKAAREQAAREQAAREQASREQASREQAAREQAAREQAAREQAAREQATREQVAREEAARQKAEQERLARQKAEQEQLARQKAEQERVTREAAERQRLEDERKRAEAAAVEQKRADEERRHVELAALEQKRTEERQRAEAAALEQTHRDEERRRAELAALEQKRADEERKRIELAALEQKRIEDAQKAEAARRDEEARRVASAVRSEDAEQAAWAQLEAEQRRRAQEQGATVPRPTERAPSGPPSGLALAPAADEPHDMKVASLPDALGGERRVSPAFAAPTETNPPARISPPPEKPVDMEALVKQAQEQLDRIGCYDGPVDGDLGSGTRDALARYHRHLHQPVSATVSEDLIKDLKRHKARVCPLECGEGERARGNRCVALPKPKSAPVASKPKPTPAPVAARPRPAPAPHIVERQRPRPAPVTARARPAPAPAAEPAPRQVGTSSRPVLGVGF